MITMLRSKLANVLTDAAHKGLEKIDENSPVALELKNLDVEKIIKEDVDKICSKLTFTEITRIMSLAVQLKSNEYKRGLAKSELKRIVNDKLRHIEAESGKLQIPSSCREMLFNL